MRAQTVCHEITDEVESVRYTKSARVHIFIYVDNKHTYLFVHMYKHVHMRIGIYFNVHFQTCVSNITFLSTVALEEKILALNEFE